MNNFYDVRNGKNKNNNFIRFVFIFLLSFTTIMTSFLQFLLLTYFLFLCLSCWFPKLLVLVFISNVVVSFLVILGIKKRENFLLRRQRWRFSCWFCNFVMIFRIETSFTFTSSFFLKFIMWIYSFSLFI